MTQDSVETGTIKFPCAFLESAFPVTYKAQPDHVWTIICPEVFWIELSVITLDLPISGPHCATGYVAFLHLVGEPPNVKYCGRKPQEILYASSKLIVIQHIQRLRSELKMSLKYQYATKQLQMIHQRMPYILGNYRDYCALPNRGLCQTIFQVLLVEIPHHTMDMTGIVRYHILCIPNDLLQHILTVDIHAGECNYVQAYDGPGIYSPRMGNSSTHGAVYSVQTTQLMYIEMWGLVQLCRPVRIEYRNERIMQTFNIPLDADNKEPVHCSNTSYEMPSYDLVSGDIEFHVQSSNEHNVWCRRGTGSGYWRTMLKIEFHGPNNLFLEEKASSCQFGGVNILAFKHEKSRAFCETLFLENDYDSRLIQTVYVRFYTGYSSGSVKLRLHNPVDLGFSFNWNGVDGDCLSSLACASNITHIWDESLIEFIDDGSIKEKTNYLFFDAYPMQYSFWIVEPLDINHLTVLITAGKEDGSVILGLVHFVLSLHCSERSICATECIIIGSSMLTPNSTHDVFEGSVEIDEHVGYARMISLFVNVSHVDEVELKIAFKKVQHCERDGLNHYARQLAYDDCDFIKVRNTLGYAHFLTQLMQGLTIELDPSCPVKECIDINVKAIPICAISAPFEWKNTALEHVPIIVNASYSAASLTWTQTEQCSADFQSVQHLCDIWIKVDVRRLLATQIFSDMVDHYEYLTVPVSPNTQQLYEYRM